MKHNRSLPRRAYTDPRIADAERAEVFGKQWVAVGLVGQLPHRGSYFTADVAGQPVLVVRDDSGDVAAFANVCMHRGTLLCVGSGRVNELVCPNHGWRYALDGRLTETPWFDRVQGFDRGGAGLVPVRLTVWQGVVLVTLDADVPELEAPSPLLDRYGIADLRCARTTRYEFPGNWKIVAENLSEAYHIPYVHGSLEDSLPLDSFAYGETRGVLSTWSYLEDGPAENFAVLGEAGLRRTLPGLDDDGRTRLRMWRLFPNLELICSPDHIVALIITPVDVTRTRLTVSILVEDGVADVADVHATLDKAMHEDAWIVGRMQQGLASESFESGRLAVPYEDNVLQLHRQVRHRLEAAGYSLDG